MSRPMAMADHIVSETRIVQDRIQLSAPSGGISKLKVAETRGRLALAGEKPTPLSQWYTAGADFAFYEIAQEACRESKKRLAKQKLTAEERRILLALPSDAEGIITKLKLIVNEESRAGFKEPKWQKKLQTCFVGFSRVVDKTAGLVGTMLPQSPEYTVTFGLLVLLFRAVVTKHDREDDMMNYLDALAAKLPVVEFYRTTFPTNALKVAVANIYCHVTQFLEEAFIYHRGGRLGKLVDAVLQPAENKFNTYMENIAAEVKKMEDLKNVAHEAQTVDIQEVVTQTSRVVEQMHEDFHETSIALGFSMELMNTRLVHMEYKVDQMHTHSMICYAQSLRSALLSTSKDMPNDAETTLAQLSTHVFRLSQKDHWYAETNAILDLLVAWTRSHAPLFWIGGTSGYQDPWISELSVDMVHALNTQQLTVLYIFCTDLTGDSEEKDPTLRTLMKSLIIQLLELHPQLAYEDAGYYSVDWFQRANTFDKLWQIFSRLATKVTDLFIIIDRIEECAVDKSANLKQHFLPALADLLPQISGSRAIITSVYEVPEELVGSRYDKTVAHEYIDTE